MDPPTGMVAIVHGLPESSLAVTLLDGNRQYTLMPNNDVRQLSYVDDSQKPTQYASKGVYQDRHFGVNSHSSIQAVDGRYASVYQVAHCNVQPTSPPVQLTEFPPQRAELCRGQGNFQVSGLGSGETKYSPVRANGSYRGGLSWPERGAVFSPRPSQEPDAFAKSLRKYPHMSPERASEVMERLINYTQAKNFKSPVTRQSSPARSISPSYSQTCERRSCITSVRPQRIYEAKRTNSVNTGTQVEVPMISKEVATVPRKQPPTQNVAIPQCPSSSFFDSLQLQPESKHECLCKSIQTSEALDLTLKIRRSVQTCISYIDLIRGSQEKNKKVENSRKSKSQEIIRTNDSHDAGLHEKVIKLIKDQCMCHETDSRSDVRNRLLKRLEKQHKTDQTDMIKITFGKCIRDQLSSHVNFKNFTKELSNELISEIKSHIFISGHSSTNVFRAETDLTRKSEQVQYIDTVDELITEWLNQIPIKQKDYLGRTVEKEHILCTVANKIKLLIKNNGLKENYGLLTEIFDVLGDIPIEVDVQKKNNYLKSIIHDLVTTIENISTNNATDRKRWKKTVGIDKTLKTNLRTKTYLFTHVQPTEEELNTFVKKQVNDLISKFSLKLCPDALSEIQVELTDILIDSIESVRYGNNEQVKEEIFVALSELMNISQHEATYFVNNLISNMKHMFKETIVDKNSQNLFFAQDTTQHPSLQTQNNTTDFSIEKINDNDMQNYLDLYSQQIVQEITEWFLRIQVLRGVKADSLQVAANGLAADIVDRHIYLEQNPDTKSTDLDETEQLKNLINKWVTKLVEKNKSEPIEAVFDLMQRIRKIPAPMLIRPVQNVDTCRPDQCLQSSSSKINVAQAANSSAAGVTRRFSSQGAVSTEIVQSCSAKCKSKENRSSFKNSTEAVSEPKRVSFPLITNTNLVQPPKEVSRNKKFSGPDNSTSGKTPLAGPSCSPRKETSTSKSLSSPVGASQLNDSKDNTVTMTRKKLNDEYDEYLKNWVQEIPISSSNPEEAALAEKLRLGIYNGIWKAITKLKLNPTVLNNTFYYQDVLDEEIEELLGLLPQIPELVSKKLILKCKLLEKTTDMNQQIIDTIPPSSFKENIIQSISITLNGQYLDPTDRNIHKACEELYKLNLAENFILFNGYKEINNVKANVYKKKVLKRIQELYDDLKRVHGKEMVQSDFGRFQSEIISSLYKVPLPNDTILKEEADEIHIGLEIDHWFTDLPLRQASNRAEELTRMRNRDILANKIHDMEKQAHLSDCEDELRQEIARFLSRLALTEEEAKHMPFMVEELVNRLKNRQGDIVAGSVLPRQPYFAHPDDYADFSRNMNLCSSFADAPVDKPAQTDPTDRSYYIADGERVELADFSFKDPDAYQRLQEIPSDEFHTLMSSHSLIPPPKCSGTKVPGHQGSVRQASNGQGMQSKLQDSGSLMRNPQDFIPCQTRAPPSVRDEMIGRHVPPDLSFRDPVADVRALQRSLRQSPQTTRFPDANISGGFPREITVSDQRSARSREPGGNQTDHIMSSSFPKQRIISDEISPRSKGPGGLQEIPSNFGGMPGHRIGTQQRFSGSIGPENFQEDPNISGAFPGQITLQNQKFGTIQEDPRYSSARFSAVSKAYGHEGSTRPYETTHCGPECTRPYEMNQAAPQRPSGRGQLMASERPQLTSPGAFSRQPINLTPQQNAPPPLESNVVQSDISGVFSGQKTLPRQRSGTIQEDPKYRSPRFLPVPTVYGPEGSTRHYKTAEWGPEYTRPYETSQAIPHGPSGTEMLMSSERPYLTSPGAFSRQPMDFSTPQQNGHPQHMFRPTKRAKEINRSRRDNIRKRIDLEDSNDSGVEMRCRCMERVWRCRRRPAPCMFDDYDMDFPCCFPTGYPYPCYF